LTPQAIPAVWLAGIAVRLPRQVQPAAELERAVGRPAGWLERRAGILQRGVWDTEDPLEAASECATLALRTAGVPPDRLGALVTVSEAPPLAIGLAAAIHHRIGLRPQIPCFELGGACTGFLSALALGGGLIHRAGPIVIVSVEAHSRLLPLAPGPQGESAALFGDGAVAVVLAGEPATPGSAKLIDLWTFVDGSTADLIRVQQSQGGSFCLEMEGVPLAEYALRAMASATREIASQHKLPLSKLAAVVAHGGNGRMPAMLARQLHLPLSKVWSDVSHTGNLGSASVPVAWASRAASVRGPVIWTAFGAGLQWGAALWRV